MQRYPRDWAQALREMAELDAEMMLPGHGLPVVGAERVQAALEDTAALLESIVRADARADEPRARRSTRSSTRSRAPAGAASRKPYLRPVYDEPEFIVRNLWRLYGGWYDGNPAHLKPAPAAELAAELARAGRRRGAAGRARASSWPATGALRLAGHLAELALQADPARTPRATRAPR